MKIRPVSSDSRYTITLEYTGKADPQYVLRFCGEWIASSAFYSSMVTRAIGESQVRRGALVITEQTK